jgi:hypothetical protein
MHEIGELRKQMKIREGTRKAQSSVLVLSGGSETRSEEGPSIPDGNAVMRDFSHRFPKYFYLLNSIVSSYITVEKAEYGRILKKDGM